MSALRGRRVLVTRPRSQGTRLNEAIEAAGGDVLWIPAIEIVGAPPDDAARSLLAKLPEFDWAAFTSESAVRHFFEWIEAEAVAWPFRLRAASVGAVTTNALKARGVRVDAQPENHTARELGRLMVREYPPGRALLPRGDAGREELSDILKAGGWEVVPVVCYVNRPVALTNTQVYAVEQGLDAAVFASPSAIKALWSALPETGKDALRRAACVPIGPTTAEALEEVGLKSAAVPGTHTVEGVVAALVEHFARR